MAGRITYWDNVRGVAILLVILAHSLHASVGMDPIDIAISSFHVYLFMVVSGYLFAGSLRHTTPYLLLTKGIQLVLPVLLFGTADYFIGYFDPQAGVQANLVNWYARCLRTLWFCQALFFCTMIVLVGNRVFKKKEWIFYILVLCAFLVFPDFAEQRGTKAMFPAFLFGYYMKKQGWETVLKDRLSVLFPTSALAFSLLLVFYRSGMNFENLGVCIFSGKAPWQEILYVDFYRVLIGLAGSVMTMSLLYWLEYRANACKHGILASIGRHTLWIYIIHVYLWVYYFRHFSESLPHTYWMTLVVFLALLGVSYPLSVLMDRVWAGLQGRALKICHVSE